MNFITLIKRLERVAGYIALPCGLAFIVFATLWPFRFSFTAVSFTEFVSNFDALPTGSKDLLRNILLFVPFGYGLATLIRNLTYSRGTQLLIISLFGFACSTIIESVQVFIPIRNPNVHDIWANTLGIIAGFYASHRLAGLRHLALLLGRCVQPKPALAILVVYILFVLLGGHLLITNMAPGKWDGSYRLAVGDEISGGRAWEGEIQDFLIFGRSITQAKAADLLMEIDSLPARKMGLGRYYFQDDQEFSDKNGNLPELFPTGTTETAFGNSGLILTNGLSLKSDKPVPSLAKAVNNSKAFTIATTVATLSTYQKIQPRIISFSQDPWHRNFSLGQADANLFLRTRSAISGGNGARPQFNFPKVFSTMEKQRLILSVDGITIQLYSTNPSYSTSLVLGPEFAFKTLFQKLGTTWPVKATPGGLLFLSILPLLTVFVPLGFLLSIGTSGFGSRMYRNLWTIGGMLLVVLLMEGFVTLYHEGSFRWPYVLVNFIFASLGAISAPFIERFLARVAEHG